MDNYTEVLWHEFTAEEGSFLLQLRCDLVWDRAAFSHLTEAMLACCKVYDRSQPPTLFGPAYDAEKVPRWLAEGFYYLSFFVRGWTTHPAWKNKTSQDQEYYDKAYERLSDLADWFFTGHSPYMYGKGFEPL